MSGYKRATINITRDEYDRLRDAELNLRQVPEVPVQIAENIRTQSANALSGSNQEIQERHAVFQQVLARMDHSIRQAESTTARALVQMQADVLKQAQQNAGELWSHVTQALQEQERSITSSIRESQRKNQEALAQLSNALWQVQESTAQKQAAAEEWITTIRALFAFIQENYACEFFMPGVLPEIERSIEQGRINLQGGLFEAVILSAQQDFFRLSDMRLELEALHNRWQMLLLANWETANQILSHAVQSEQVQANDLDGSPLPFTIQVDFWAQGRLSDLVNRLTCLLDAMSGPSPSFSIDTLQEWRETLLPEFYDELSDIILDARISALNSQMRINIADLVVQALRKQGFALDASSYAAMDERQEYQAHMVNAKGNEVVVHVTPTGQALGENELQLESHDRALRTEHELRQRWHEIHRALRGFGLNVGATVREEHAPYNAAQRQVSAERRKVVPSQRGRRSGLPDGD
jgi:hypothetical protein